MFYVLKVYSYLKTFQERKFTPPPPICEVLLSNEALKIGICLKNKNIVLSFIEKNYLFLSNFLSKLSAKSVNSPLLMASDA